MVHDQPLALTLELTQARLGLFEARLRLFEARLGLLERFGGAVALAPDARDLFAPVSIAVTSLLGFVFPLISAVSDFGQLAHEALFHQDRPPEARGDHGVRFHMAYEDRAIRGVMHLQSEHAGPLR